MNAHGEEERQTDDFGRQYQTHSPLKTLGCLTLVMVILSAVAVSIYRAATG